MNPPHHQSDFLQLKGVVALSGSLVRTGFCAEVKGTLCTEAHLYKKVDMCCVKENAPPLQDDVDFMFYVSSVRKPKFGGPIRTALRNQRSTDV